MTEAVMYKEGGLLEIMEPLDVYCLDTNESSDEGAQLIRSHGGDFVRQPCKARGVNIKPGQNPHVARYAYIDIPMGTRHGTVLSCCHPVCIASGRRFRFCAHCETAVAKRNFNVRHAHGNMNSPPPKDISPPIVISDAPLQVEAVIESDTDDQVVDPTDGIPTVISIDDHKSVKSSNDENSSAITCSLTRYEIDFINLLRSRPGNDYKHELDQWRVALLCMADKKTSGSDYQPKPCVPEQTHSLQTNYLYPPEMATSEEASVASFGPEGRLDDLDFSSVEDFFPL